MKLTPFLIICLIAFALQIAFSIYYSLAIVDQNTLINNQQKTLTELGLQNQRLKIELAALTSISRLSEASGSASVPITKNLDLR